LRRAGSTVSPRQEEEIQIRKMKINENNYNKSEKGKNILVATSGGHRGLSPLCPPRFCSGSSPFFAPHRRQGSTSLRFLRQCSSSLLCLEFRTGPITVFHSRLYAQSLGFQAHVFDRPKAYVFTRTCLKGHVGKAVCTVMRESCPRSPQYRLGPRSFA
jgi:hypothetical protein